MDQNKCVNDTDILLFPWLQHLFGLLTAACIQKSPFPFKYMILNADFFSTKFILLSKDASFNPNFQGQG